ncbi:MAG: glutamate-1-semialdehyde 2,1-aminomutase [Gammaproteobacteria bacterium AqS3]|nr:glutamate-1-semialdehyde 2,1-aminomutase [Gammaproteobacteria bacterium AqS3]
MSRSEELFRRARQVIPGGVNSPVRAFHGVGGAPRFIERAQGAWLWDADGNRLLDALCSWGAIVLGHADDRIARAVGGQLARGSSYGAPTEAEVEMAELLCRCVPALEQVRLVSSGTEATMSALRLARAATGRTKVIKFDGCYHGHVDSLLINAGSGPMTLGTSSSPGVVGAEATLSLPYNDAGAVDVCIEAHGADLAAIIVEPIAANMNLIPPADGFLARLRSACDQSGALLIFDEVISGFRIALGGAEEVCGVRPDLIALGKIIGGGLPVGAFGGRADLVSQMAPDGPVYQAGTLSGNPLAVCAGLTVLRCILDDADFYPRLSGIAQRCGEGLAEIAGDLGIPLQVRSLGGLYGIAFAEAPVTSLADMQGADHARYRDFFAAMLRRGVHLPPSVYEACFVSQAYDEEVIGFLLEAARGALADIA